MASGNTLFICPSYVELSPLFIATPSLISSSIKKHIQRLMDLVHSITDIILLVWTCSAKHANYFRRLEKNLKDLRTSMDELKEVRNDVKRRVNEAEARLLTQKFVVSQWLERVEALESDVDGILQEGPRQIGSMCFTGCCPKYCWSSYRLGKKVIKMLSLVKDLSSKGVFDVVAERKYPAPVQAVPENTTVGMDSVFAAAWRSLGDDAVGIIGLFGMGGVGKTTLLRKINNEFHKTTTSVFDYVLWVVVSKEVNIRSLQNDVGRRLGLSWEEGTDTHLRASDLFNVLKSKRFVLLLDDIWEHLDLLSIGIPRPDSVNRSKIVFTTRSEVVCGYMEADRKIEVKCLSRDEAWALFQSKVGQETLNLHQEVPKLAEIVAKECGGLPLALIVIGRSMRSKKTAKEWKHAITTLKKRASEFSGMENEVFHLLKFSYDSLPNDMVKSCFLFCSLYPEDDMICVERLVEQWIGKGYINDFDTWDEALNTGYDIVGILKATCLLESLHLAEEEYVKMHDIIRDLALWIACECGRDKYKVFTATGTNEAPKAEIWTRAESISLINTSITHLNDVPQCPYLSTLLLFDNNANIMLKHIPDDFFLFMPSLQYLDLSWTGITKLPTSIGALGSLEYLDLTSTEIRELPSEMKKLIRLRYLSLKYTDYLHNIPGGVIMHLLNLQVVKLCDYNFGYSEEDKLAGIRELGCLNQLKLLEIEISNLNIYKVYATYPRLVLSTRCTAYK